jgi:hypothetical protein
MTLGAYSLDATLLAEVKKMAGFRLRDELDIDGLLTRLTQAVLDECKREQMTPSATFEKSLEFTLKRVLNHCMEASPMCGLSSTCRPSEGMRARPWSRQAASWGLIARADPRLEEPTRHEPTK